MSENSIAKGGSLTAESWADFVDRLRHDCVGKGVESHHTADPIFIVQARRLIFGIDRDFIDERAVIFDDRHWLSVQAYWDDCCEEERERLDKTAKEESDDDDATFLGLSESDQWDLLENLPDHTVTGWDERWEHVSAHLTRDAANAFITRKAHDYRDGMRVHVDAQVYCWEFKAVIEGVLSGRIGFIPEESRP